MTPKPVPRSDGSIPIMISFDARFARKNCARRFAADALFHLLKLPQRDSHAEMLPAAMKLQKQKRQRKFSVMAFCELTGCEINVPACSDSSPACRIVASRTMSCWRAVTAQAQNNSGAVHRFAGARRERRAANSDLPLAELFPAVLANKSACRDRNRNSAFARASNNNWAP